jgi:Fe-S cluster assembly protein SufD
MPISATRREHAMIAIKAEAAPYLAAFRPDEARDPAWLGEIRRDALARFGERGFPTRSEEAWRFTNLRPLARRVLLPVEGAIPSALAYADHALEIPTHRLVFINGRFSDSQSRVGRLPAGVWLDSTARTLRERPDLARRAFDPSDIAGGQPFASLNAALFADGYVLALEPDAVLDRPVEIIHIGDAKAESFHLRNAIVMGANSRAAVIETYVGRGSYWTNAVTSVRLAERATLTQVKLQDEDPEAIHLAVARATVGRGARYRGFGLTLGGLLSRQDIHVALDDGAECAVNGAYLLRGAQESTNAVVIDHDAPNGVTRELWKGVMDDRAHGVFLGRIAVRPDAQKSDAQQTNRNLLLSDRAAVDTKPELEILADDVKCSHGAAVGELDSAMLFYLRARGIGLEEARRLLVEAFALEAVDTVEEPDLRKFLAQHVRRWLAGEKA